MAIIPKETFDLMLIVHLDYNFGNIVFAFSYLASELPSQLITKKIGPDRWIPVQVTLWSIAAAAQSGITGRKSFLALRCILGAIEVCSLLSHLEVARMLILIGRLYCRSHTLAVIFLYLERTPGQVKVAFNPSTVVISDRLSDPVLSFFFTAMSGTQILAVSFSLSDFMSCSSRRLIEGC
jgi:hypothetical protein